MKIFAVTLEEKDSFQYRASVKNILQKDFASKSFESSIGNIAVRHAVSNLYGIRLENVYVSYSKSGAPFIQGRPDIFISMSHTKGWVVCAVSDYRIGIDAEVRCSFNMDVVRRFFSTREQMYVLGESSENRESLFFELWTAKESMLKFYGIGLEYLLRCEIIRDGAVYRGRMRGTLCEATIGNIWYKEAHLVSVCSQASNYPIIIVESSVASLLAQIGY